MNLLMRKTLRESSSSVVLFESISFKSFIIVHSNGRPSIEEKVLPSSSNASTVNASGESSK